MQFTEHFNSEELYRSDTATRQRIDNMPLGDAWENLQLLCREILEPIRKQYGKPIVVNSAYRCRKLNDLLHGASNSDHVWGCAADIRSLSGSKQDNKILWSVILDMVKHGQLHARQIIDEYNFSWIHISMNHGRNKRKNNEILHLG